MSRLSVCSPCVLLIVLIPVVALSDSWQATTTLPVNRANNAVASHTSGGTCYVYSFMGIDETRLWSGIQKDAWRLDTGTGVWEQLPDVPGSVGRIGAAAAGVGDRVYLFSGYSVAASGFETTWDAVDIFDPASMTWSSGTPFPRRTDDQIIGVYNDRYVYNISGWSQNTNIRDVQIYDTATDTWQIATDITGPPVFGGAGAIVGNEIIYADGVSNAFVTINVAYRGVIDPSDITQISWELLPTHPGSRGYRMAAGVPDGAGSRVYFAGGTDNAHNFNGMGYNGQPSEPLDGVFAYDIVLGDWVPLTPKLTPTMDHRGFACCGGGMYVAGGYVANQVVSGVTEIYTPDATAAVAGEAAVPRPPAGIRLAATPLPARASVDIRFELRRSVDTRVSIYDAQGRLVRTLLDETLAAAEHSLAWNLRDATGRRVPRGVYLARVQFGAAVESIKLVVDR